MKLKVLDYVVLVVEELDRSLAFYCDVLGLELAHRAGPYAQIQAGTTRLGLYSREAMEDTLGIGPLSPPSRRSPGFELGFKVEDVDAVFAELVARGAEPAVFPVTRFWGQRTGYLRDPDGYLIELAQDGVRPDQEDD